MLQMQLTTTLMLFNVVTFNSVDCLIITVFAWFPSQIYSVSDSSNKMETCFTGVLLHNRDLNEYVIP